MNKIFTRAFLLIMLVALFLIGLSVVLFIQAHYNEAALNPTIIVPDDAPPPKLFPDIEVEVIPPNNIPEL